MEGYLYYLYWKYNKGVSEGCMALKKKEGFKIGSGLKSQGLLCEITLGWSFKAGCILHVLHHVVTSTVNIFVYSSSFT